ncbi:MAG TPA: carboxypeptidase regulatory-like domain-containing protein [Gemmatimonadales bacterium]|jgi:hypothetical protein|nr:carboxypeptidase regulatory-like domain-containing protein [Gemmatimonadales bacterium]
MLGFFDSIPGCRSLRLLTLSVTGLGLVLSARPALSQDPAAQEGSARILVIDDETGEPIPGAFIRIKGRSPDVLTDEKGRVTIPGIKQGRYTVDVGAIGYESRREAMLVQSATADLRYGLSFTGDKLPDVVVEARQEKLYPRYSDFHRRVKNGAGFYITWREIHAKGYSRLGDVLRGVRGVQVACRPSDCLILMSRSRSCPPAIWVDGRPSDFYGGNTPIGDIYGMEVYRGPSELPAEFTTNGMCGAIVLWTKNRSYR